ncbi:hydroxyisourate hydrolase [Basidiobolus meristosporus CBS 931.73]|uniref:5-hydroxyisourate hydrolase n=1 Tax=Basidiobolus meristosporus CBS 931.73 TaxID=1314790 RepID=A0A1Y1VZJ6_9FUNG|nr:hydroxyisourate hydrolase [Basidiobolus meristosporus CBS 931.73]ORX96245.1 hydroxyisourate hydrolase [Basidiobolus meristosporus CBS 931.73]|eukprot:ORX66681.1 hydroxyisourate hydrolase [Basidiobolus meristosporus CBS 931.73]
MRTRSPVTAHVLDSSVGRPAQDVKLTIEKLENIHWQVIGGGLTNTDGRCPELLALDYDLKAGIYQVTFETAEYYERQGKKCFYPYVKITFEITNPEEHYHIPLLLSPYSYSTYRGS